MHANPSTTGTLGRYRLLGRIATGGMAEVYLAETQGPHGVVRRCIIKRILPGFAEREEFATAFVDEARIGSTLTHPNLVTTLDFDEIDGQLFLALEYVDGPDLSAFRGALAKAGQPMPLAAACTILTGVLYGLAYAHKATDDLGRPLAIVHRDVNPPNILLSRSGTVKLADFGIARAASRLTSTRHGHLKGKIPYMSPEQAEGLRLDGRSDLFSSGVVLYELLTGGRLFGGSDEMESLRQVRQAAIRPPSAYRDDVDGELDRICLKALERDRTRRYATAEAFCADLEAYRAGRFPGYGHEQLAELIREHEHFWEHAREVQDKTPALDGASLPLPLPAKQSTPGVYSPKRSRLSILSLLGGLLLVALLFLWLFTPRPSRETVSDMGPAGPQATLEIAGGNGAFVLLEDILLGRAPLSKPVSAEKKGQQLEILGPGIVPHRSGTTIQQGKQRRIDADRKLVPGAGVIRFEPLPSGPVFIDGREVSAADGSVRVPVGVHRIQWQKEDFHHEHIVQVRCEEWVVLPMEKN